MPLGGLGGSGGGLGGTVRYLSDAEGDNVTNQQPGNIARAWELWKEGQNRLGLISLR